MGQFNDVQIEIAPGKRKNYSLHEDNVDSWNESISSYKRARKETTKEKSSILETIEDQVKVSPLVGSAAANTHIIAPTSLKKREAVYLIGEVPCYAKKQ
ncbi:hypothetical protein J1N35_001975 [Gossypium stocksii]|uniref:Uncharacterized protein n=1 Tax=Gossypium stocksii TaxID=47602 RepID=A0A9D3WK53_9ROSI|nr:hypothetical protein J1N35_001975 [Gossypium stocksii]